MAAGCDEEAGRIQSIRQLLLPSRRRTQQQAAKFGRVDDGHDIGSRSGHHHPSPVGRDGHAETIGIIMIDVVQQHFCYVILFGSIRSVRRRSNHCHSVRQVPSLLNLHKRIQILRPHERDQKITTGAGRQFCDMPHLDDTRHMHARCYHLLTRVDDGQLRYRRLVGRRYLCQ